MNIVVTLTGPQLAILLLVWMLWMIWAITRIRRANVKLRKSEKLLNASRAAAYDILDCTRPIDLLSQQLKEIWVDLPAKSEEDELERAALLSLGAISYDQAIREQELAVDGSQAIRQIQNLRDYLEDARHQVSGTYDNVVDCRDRLRRVIGGVDF